MRSKLLLGVLVAFMLSLASVAFAADMATPDEVVTKVKEAAAFLGKSGDAGLKEFQDKGGRWVWKDTYVFVAECKKGTNLAHPMNPKQQGTDQTGLTDKKGNYFFVQFCDVAEKSGAKGGWVEYWWPKPGATDAARKVSYVLAVPGKDMFVGAGIYSDKESAKDLNVKLK